MRSQCVYHEQLPTSSFFLIELCTLFIYLFIFIYLFFYLFLLVGG